jgi:DNA-binding MarR family transcriptional regulator
MLTEVDLRVLSALQTPASLSELADTTDYSAGYLSERISHLEELDLVTTTRKNRTKIVRVVHTSVLDAFRRLTVEHPHIDIPSLISPSMLKVCWFLDRPTGVSEIEPYVPFQRRRIYQLLDNLQSRGLLVKRDNRYVLTPRIRGLASFAQTVSRYEHQHRAEAHAGTATIIWSGPNEALAAINGESADVIASQSKGGGSWEQTGLPRFHEYGLDFFISEAPLYFYSDVRETIIVEDIICHTLLAETDTRNLSYCALLLLAEDVARDTLHELARYYRIEETIDALTTFVGTAGNVHPEHGRLPEWDNVTSLADQYGVTVPHAPHE